MIKCPYFLGMCFYYNLLIVPYGRKIWQLYQQNCTKKIKPPAITQGKITQCGKNFSSKFYFHNWIWVSWYYVDWTWNSLKLYWKYRNYIAYFLSHALLDPPYNLSLGGKYAIDDFESLELPFILEWIKEWQQVSLFIFNSCNYLPTWLQ